MRKILSHLGRFGKEMALLKSEGRLEKTDEKTDGGKQDKRIESLSYKGLGAIGNCSVHMESKISTLGPGCSLLQPRNS